jgi:hypothetical protein
MVPLMLTWFLEARNLEPLRPLLGTSWQVKCGMNVTEVFTGHRSHLLPPIEFIGLARIPRFPTRLLEVYH